MSVRFRALLIFGVVVVLPAPASSDPTGYEFVKPICSENNRGAILKATHSRDGDALVLDVLPDLSPATSDNLVHGGHGRMVTILISNPYNLNFLWALRIQKKDRSTPFTMTYGLKKFTTPNRWDGETYFSDVNGVVRDLIECSADGLYPSPGCEQYINHGAFTIKASYGKNYLPTWMSIRATIEAMIDQCTNNNGAK